MLTVALALLITGLYLGHCLKGIRRELTASRLLQEQIAEARGISLVAYGAALDDLAGNIPSSESLSHDPNRKERIERLFGGSSRPPSL